MNASGPIVQASIRGLTSGPRRFVRASYAWRPDRDTIIDLNYPFPHCDLLQQEAHLFLRQRSRRQCHTICRPQYNLWGRHHGPLHKRKPTSFALMCFLYQRLCATTSLQRRSCRLVVSQSHGKRLRERHSGSILPVGRSLKASLLKHMMSHRSVHPLSAYAAKFAPL